MCWAKSQSLLDTDTGDKFVATGLQSWVRLTGIQESIEDVLGLLATQEVLAQTELTGYLYWGNNSEESFPV
jgi:hypothetical protein